MKRRKSKNPVATRYRIAVTALRKAERRKTAAEQSIRELQKRVRYYERTIAPEERATLKAADNARAAATTEGINRRKTAMQTMMVTARMAGMPYGPEAIDVMWSIGKVHRAIAYAIRISGAQDRWDILGDRMMVWSPRRGFLFGTYGQWRNRDLSGMRRVRETPSGIDPIAWRAVA